MGPSRKDALIINSYNSRSDQAIFGEKIPKVDQS